jgi:hypothetical protein
MTAAYSGRLSASLKRERTRSRPACSASICGPAIGAAGLSRCVPGTHAVWAGDLLPPPGHAVSRRTWEQYLTASLQAGATGATQTD